MSTPELQVLANAIDARIGAAREEIASLESARAALAEAGLASTSSVVARGRRATRSAAASNGAGPDQATPRRGTSGPATQGRASSGRATPGRRRRVTRTVSADELVALLAGSPDGLSARALAERTDAPATQVSERLQELERAGTVRRAGERRTRRWRVVTDEERIAERVAELEAARSGPSPASE